MTNYNEILDEILEELVRDGQNDVDDFSLNTSPHKIVAQNGAKQAITSITKELVAEAKPGYDAVKNSERDKAIDEFEQNLLKVLEEV